MEWCHIVCLYHISGCVCQGGLLSPLLFVVSMDVLKNRLWDAEIGVSWHSAAVLWVSVIYQWHIVGTLTECDTSNAKNV